MGKEKCKHEWQVVKENPYCPISTNDSWGKLCQFVCVCLKCNKFKTIVAERIEEQVKDLKWRNEGYDAPSLPIGQKLGDENIKLVEDS